ncbi:hypothetical protein [Streptomyces sp. CMB-StM0423]|uniref:hypothetical protein n=1 Tax=Streptomyces sp. CMB-StM0423 TaxID=2059884 RepID=UPI00131D45DF|nr:hypothetical protein [Streptomyces sp. CMB-StM0423]
MPDPAPQPVPRGASPGLTPRGWRAAGRLVGNCAGLSFLVPGLLAVLGTITAIAVALAAG